jgi:hypothetical protein
MHIDIESTPTIAQQLRSQEIKFKGDKVKYFESLRTSITNLSFAGMITKEQQKALTNKLHRKISNHVNNL